jgi:hypothetical protein
MSDFKGCKGSKYPNERAAEKAGYGISLAREMIISGYFTDNGHFSVLFHPIVLPDNQTHDPS